MKSQMARSHYVDFAFIAGLGLMYFCSIATIFWGADRCLGLGDEGLYLLASRYPEEIQQNVSSIYIYTGYLFQLVNFDPVKFRILGVILVCISAGIFWFGFYKFLSEFCPEVKKLRHFRLYSLFFIELGALLHYQSFYMTPNYNTLIGLAISISTGSFLWGFSLASNWQNNSRLIIPAFGLGGLGIGWALFTKLPAGICLFFLYFLLIFLWRGITRHQKAVLSASILTGISGWFLGHFVFSQPPQIWWAMLKEGWTLYQAYGAHTPSKSLDYVKDLSFFVYSAVKIYWPCYLIICSVYPFYILRRSRSNLSKKANSMVILAVMLIATLLSVKAGAIISERKPTDGAIPFYIVFHFAWILLLLAVWFFNSWYKSKCCGAPQKNSVNVNITIVLGLLIALPVAGSVGTSNPLYNIPLCFAAAWFGVILLLLVVSTDGERFSSGLRTFGLLSIGMFTASQIIQGYIFDPQLMVKTNVLEQVEATEVGYPARTLKLDMQTHNLVQYFSAIARINGFQPGGDIIAMSYIPGLVYAMGGKSPGHPTFLLNLSKNKADYTRLALQYADINRLRNAFVILNADPAYAEPLLKGRGVNFPDGYKKLGAAVIYGANFSLWKPVHSTSE